MTRHTDPHTTDRQAAAVLDMLRDAKRIRDAAGRPDATADAMLDRAERGDFGRSFGPVSTASAGRPITGVVADPTMLDGKRFTYARPAGRSNGSSSHRPAEPITGPQEGKIYVLLRQVPADVAAAARPWFEANKATMTKAQASDVIDRLKRHAADRSTATHAGPDNRVMQAPSTSVAAPDRSAAWAEWRLHAAALVELGGQHGARFAIPSATGNNDLDFWSIVKRDGDRGPRYYLNRVIGGQPDRSTRMTPETMVTVARAIRTDAKAAMIRYGQELGQCGHCGRHLTDEASRAAGIGPVCAAKHGW